HRFPVLESRPTEPGGPGANREMGPPAPLQDALAQLLKRMLNRGQSGIEKMANRGRSRLELRQMQKDLDHFWIRLGKTAYHLSNGGEIDHPGIRKAMERIDELEAHIDELRHHRSATDNQED
ncbi:MAG: hypothetical protein HN348_28160, partial [Proteobacteria bacterium]|nr:hypothetical protein [Pseudomonadota bacterium]